MYNSTVQYMNSWSDIVLTGLVMRLDLYVLVNNQGVQSHMLLHHLLLEHSQLEVYVRQVVVGGVSDLKHRLWSVLRMGVRQFQER